MNRDLDRERRALEVFESLIDLSPEESATELAAIEDPGLRDAVRSLLDEDTLGVIESGALEPELIADSLSAASAQCTAAEPLAQAIACLTPSHSANSRSNRWTNVPLVELSVPARSTACTARRSAWSNVRPDELASVGSGACPDASTPSALAGCSQPQSAPTMSFAVGACSNFARSEASASASTCGRSSGCSATRTAPERTRSQRAPAGAITTAGTPAAAANSW